MNLFKSRARGEDGASAVEYGLLLAGIAAVIVAVVFLLGSQTDQLFDRTCDDLASRTSSGSCA